MKKRGPVLVFILLVIIAVLVVLLNQLEVFEVERLGDNYVLDVIDGDTLILASGERVRLICINTPELGDSGSYEAKDFLESLVLGKDVRLEKDVSERDEYGRLLKYVYVNVSGGEIFINREIVQKGFGEVFLFEPDTKRCGEIGEGL